MELLKISLIQSSAIFMGLLLLSIGGYVENYKISRGVFNLIKYFKLTFKKIIQSSIKENTTIKFYPIKLALYLMFSFFISKAMSSGVDYQRNTFLVLCVLYYVFDMILYFEEKTKHKDVVDYFAKKSILILLILGCSIFSLFVVGHFPREDILSVVAKIAIFLNITSLLYLNEFITEKRNEEVLNKYLRKILFYFLIVSLFISLNSFGPHPQTIIKYSYFSISIILIEFMATYVKTNVGFLKTKSSRNLITSNLLVYIIVFLTLITGLVYVD
jgi:hypothetical protein